MAVAVAPSAPISVRSKMPFIRSALALMALGCAEPAAMTDLPVDSEVSAAVVATSSFSIRSDGTVYVRLARPSADAAEPIHAFMRRMFASADAAGARRLVVDLKGVVGSDARLVVPLIRGIVMRERFARSGGLYVVTGEESFAPSQTAATLLREYANPVFVSSYPAR